MNISEESLRYISELFIGDIGDIFSHKTGSQIFKFFNKYFGYNDHYSFGNNYPSRWVMAINKIIELWNKNLFNSFISKILSISYSKIENPELSNDELKTIANKAVSLLNGVFEDDGNRIIEFADSYKLIPINDDEVLLGEGGYACCYYIKSKQLVEKRLKEENYSDHGVVHRFKREFELTKSLEDIQGIIKVFELDEQRLSYTMEKGECDLYSYVMNNDLDDDFRRNIVYQIAAIMKSVHERDSIHRDLSPRNIFIFSGLIKIADFGLGKDLNAFYSHQTMKTNSVGQYYYCDPRQFMKLKDGDKQSDIYSIGKIINFVFTRDPNNSSHRYYPVSTKATILEEKYRYKTIDELINGLKRVDQRLANREFENNFNNKIQNGNKLDEDDVNFICSFDSEKMFNSIDSMEFRTAFVELGENGQLDEHTFLSKLEMLLDYVNNNRILGWSSYDKFGFLGVIILLSKCSYVIKEVAVDLLNIPLSCNRYGIINIVKREIIGQIDPSLEEKINQVVNNY